MGFKKEILILKIVTVGRENPTRIPGE